MATGSSQEASPSGNLGEDDLGKLYEALHCVKTSYKPIGLQIGVKINEIKSVEKQETDPGDRLLEILSIRVKKAKVLTWKDIVEALRSQCVGEGKVADEIQTKYGLAAASEGTTSKEHEKQAQRESEKSKQSTEGDPPINKEKVSDKQDSDSEGEGSEKVKRTSYPHNKAKRKGEEVGKTQKCLEVVKVESDDERKRKRKSKQKGEPPLYQEEVSYKQDSDSEGEGSERVKQKVHPEKPRSKAKRKGETVKEVGKTQKRLEVVESNDENLNERKRKRRSKQKGEPPLYQEEVSYKQDSDSEGEGSERVKRKIHSEKPRSKTTRKGEKVREKAEMSVACSPEQEVEISRKERNKKEGKKIVKPHFESERETERRKTKATYEKEKSEVVDDHSADYNTIQKQKRRKKVNIESGNESSTSSSDSEIVSPPLQSKTKRKEAPAQCAESFQQKEGKTKGRKRENKGHLATHKATATECSKRPTHNSEISKQVKSKLEEELSSATVSEESDNEISEVEPKRKTAMPKGRKQRTGDKRIDKKAKQLASGKEKCPKSGPKSSNQSKKERERGIPSEKKAAVVPLEPATDDSNQEASEEEQECDSDESEEEEDSEQNEEEETGPGSEPNQVVKKRGRGISSEKKAAAIPLEPASVDSSQVESGEETRNLDDRSEYKDSDQKLSSEEEETEPDGESSAATSEEEEKKIAAQPGRRKHVKGKTSTKNASATASRYDVPERSDPSPRGGVKGAKKKKKKKIKHKEREMDQSVKPSSSLSTSPEEKPTSRCQRRKIGQREGKKGKSEKRRRRAEGLMVMSSSETDDSSSPECDISKKLTDDEAKKISKVFKRFFGKLCYGIVNPVEIAAQLQEKHLISQETMIDMLNSPETKQAKTISLVLKLSKRIESRPYRMYRFIEVLLGNSVLQGAGREILRETGKVCPERTAARFPSSLPSSETPVLPLEGNKDEAKGSVSSNPADTVSHPAPTTGSCEVSQSDVPLPLEVSQSDVSLPLEVSQSDVPLPLEVSQSVALQPAGVSPVLAKYKQYLQSCYNARVLAPADKYLPTLEAPYINLAMVKMESYKSHERDEFTKRTLHGGVDQILESKTPMSMKDILSPEKENPEAENGLSPKVGGRPVRFILVEGPPGIGKSTFAWEVCRRWDEIESLRDYHTVVLLKLREKWVLNATKPSDLFRYPPDPEFSTTIASALNESYGRSLLLILDGFDEVSHSFHEISVIKSILCRQLLPECTIILTTRPVAKSTLESICQPRIDKHVEIIGFTEEERVRYITEVFSKEPELQMNFLKYMFLVPHIKSMMYIPLNCAIIAQVYYESQSSRNLTIPRTRTQLYKALSNSLLVRYMKMKNSDFECSSVLPEGLDEEDFDTFKILAKFAFDSYHKGESRKVTFFKEDIPEGLVHFGFMNESTEMYAGKGVERTFSFLHLSLQEYLAAWHLANSYSIEFQVAYHWLAVDPSQHQRREALSTYKGGDKDEKALLSSLEEQGSSLEEPAIFLAGITGWICQSQDDRNHWEMYLSHDTVELEPDLLIQSLYEAQNPNILSHYFVAEESNRRSIWIFYSLAPYHCYALGYCVAHSSVPLDLTIETITDDDVSLLETFVRGLVDHCTKSNIPRVQSLVIQMHVGENSEKGLKFWIMKAPFLSDVKKLVIRSDTGACISTDYLQSFMKLQSLTIYSVSPLSWEWVTALKSLNELKSLDINSTEECSVPPPDILASWPVEHRLTQLLLDIKFPSNTIYDFSTPVDVLLHSVLNSVLISNRITMMLLPNISRGTMAGVRSILLHCPSLTRLTLRRTRLGYDGILYICSALRINTTLEYLAIHDVKLTPKTSKTFSSMEAVPLPSKTTPTDFLLELDNILQDNTTLEEMSIQSGLFLPLSAGEWNEENCQWTGLGPLQQFNVGAVASGMSPNLRRSFSSSDLTQPQNQLFWKKRFPFSESRSIPEVNFKELFSKREEEGKKLFSLPSFTAPDSNVLLSFSGLDPRLKECLELSDLNEYVKWLRCTYVCMMVECNKQLSHRHTRYHH